jgi:hypothetical protein
LKIEVKKKIDVIFDCRTGQDRRKVISERKRNRKLKKNYWGDGENSLMLAVFSDMRTIYSALNFRRKRKSVRW